MNIPKLLVEMAVVGFGLAVLGLLVGYAWDYYKTSKVDWAPKHLKSMFFGTAFTGALFHFIFEYMGWNEWYVRQYKPLLK
jgi:hypothetical protein